VPIAGSGWKGSRATAADWIGFAGGFGNESFPRAKEKEEAEGKQYFINVRAHLIAYPIICALW